MLGTLVKFLGPLGWLVDPLSKVAEEIGKSIQAERDATTERQRIAAKERTATLRIRQKELAIDPIAPLIRLFFALPFVIYNAKLVLWDKVLEWGTTSSLSPNLVWIEGAVIGFYFLRIMWRRK